MNHGADYWLSRRPRFTTNEIFQIATNYIYEAKFQLAIKPLKLAASLNHEEARWLLNLLETSGVMPKDDNSLLTDRFQWGHVTFGAASFCAPHDSRAKAYKEWFSRFVGGELGKQHLENIRVLAEAGHANCQYLLAMELHHDDKAQSLSWHRKAAKQNFHYSMHMLALHVEQHESRAQGIQLHLEAVRCGNIQSLNHLVKLLPAAGFMSVIEKLPVTHFEAVELESLNRTRWRDHMFERLDFFIYNYVLRIADDEFKAQKISSMRFARGCFFNDYEICYPPLHKAIDNRISDDVDLYLNMSSRARRAAVQTILVLRSIGVCRDIAILIAKLVFQRRSIAIVH